MVYKFLAFVVIELFVSISFAQNFEIQCSRDKFQTNLRAIVKNKKDYAALGSKSVILSGKIGSLQLMFTQFAANTVINDWRSAHLLKNGHLIFINAGPPAYFCLRKNNSKTVEITHVDSSTGVFVDGISFLNEKTGIAFGDPQQNRVPLWRTENGGLSWEKYYGPEMIDDEAAFAAGNSAICNDGSKKVLIVSGGSQSRLLISDNKGLTFQSVQLPIIQGKATQGAFSVDILGNSIAIAGGDYSNSASSEGNFCISHDGGKNFKKALKPPQGYKSCVKFLSKSILIAVGTSGIDISYDAGENWSHLSDESFNSICVINNTSAYLAGPEGKVCHFALRKK